LGMAISRDYDGMPNWRRRTWILHCTRNAVFGKLQLVNWEAQAIKGWYIG
jgi:hypothetical protein